MGIYTSAFLFPDQILSNQFFFPAQKKNFENMQKTRMFREYQLLPLQSEEKRLMGRKQYVAFHNEPFTAWDLSCLQYF